jgi:hypothetical protein
MAHRALQNAAANWEPCLEVLDFKKDRLIEFCGICHERRILSEVNRAIDFNPVLNRVHESSAWTVASMVRGCDALLVTLVATAPNHRHSHRHWHFNGSAERIDN